LEAGGPASAPTLVNRTSNGLAPALELPASEKNTHGCDFHSVDPHPLCDDALAGAGSGQARRCRMNTLHIVSGVLALGLCAYLLYAMIKPEKF
jgi:K+-transporting ATPase KdpF subunit